MIDTFFQPAIIKIIDEIKVFFEKIGVCFYKIEHEQQGKNSYLKITISLKL